MARSLTLQRIRPDIRPDCKRYNIRGMNKFEWEIQQAQVVATPEYRGTPKLLAKEPESREGIHPAALYDRVNKVLREAFAERYAKPRRVESRNDARPRNMRTC